VTLLTSPLLKARGPGDSMPASRGQWAWVLMADWSPRTYSVAQVWSQSPAMTRSPCGGFILSWQGSFKKHCTEDDN
jgi:hypothetical protein